jgi:hypothetical protein
MQISMDNLLVALFLALSPDQDQNSANESATALLHLDQQALRLRQQSTATENLPACRIFADAEARRKCMIRTERASASGAVEPRRSYPETVIWLAPVEPSMPFKLQSNTPR